MHDKDFEEAHYWHVLHDVVDLIEYHGYDNVQDNIEYLLGMSNRHDEDRK